MAPNMAPIIDCSWVGAAYSKGTIAKRCPDFLPGPGDTALTLNPEFKQVIRCMSTSNQLQLLLLGCLEGQTCFLGHLRQPVAGFFFHHYNGKKLKTLERMEGCPTRFGEGRTHGWNNRMSLTAWALLFALQTSGLTWQNCREQVCCSRPAWLRHCRGYCLRRLWIVSLIYLLHSPYTPPGLPKSSLIEALRTTILSIDCSGLCIQKGFGRPKVGPYSHIVCVCVCALFFWVVVGGLPQTA